MLLNVIGFSQQPGPTCSAPSKDNLVKAVNILEPTTNLLMKYNPDTPACCRARKRYLDNGGYSMCRRRQRPSRSILDVALLLGDDPYKYPDNLPIVGAKGGPGGKPGCGSLPDVAKNFPVRQLVTNTGWGTGLDIRPNPGIGHPVLGRLLPGHPRGARAAEHPQRASPGRRPGRSRTRARRRTARRCTGPDGTPLWPGLPPAPPPAPRDPADTGSSRSSSQPAQMNPRQTPPVPRRTSRTRHDRTTVSRERNSREEPARRRRRLGIFLAVCLLGTFALLRGLRRSFGSTRGKTYFAEFTNVSGLKNGDFVRIAGVEVGKVKKISSTRTPPCGSSSPPTTRSC